MPSNPNLAHHHRDVPPCYMMYVLYYFIAEEQNLIESIQQLVLYNTMAGRPVDDQFADAAEGEDSSDDHEDYSSTAVAAASIKPKVVKALRAAKKRGPATSTKTFPQKKAKTSAAIAKQNAALSLLKTATAAMGPPPQPYMLMKPTPPIPAPVAKTPAVQLLLAPDQTGDSAHTARKPLSIKKVEHSHVNCVPTFAVRQASRLVAQNLRLFPEASPGVHLQAAVAIENFGTEVILPNMLAAHGRVSNKKTHPAKVPEEIDHNRVFYASLLSLREILAQNAHAFFRISAPSGEVSTTQDEDEKEEQTYAKLLMATTIIIAACHAADKDVDVLLQAVEQSDDMPAPRALHSWHCKTPDKGPGKRKEEALAWKVGYNLAQAIREKRKELDHRMSLPKPTAVYMSVVEQIPAAIKKSSAYDL
jgi:hypothetical protein